jgi:uncharacterized phiE125 gp8 family phage protein
MIDIEVVTDAPGDAWRSIVDTYEMKLHMRMLSDALDSTVEECLIDAIAICDMESDIRRCALPRTLRFHRTCWPSRTDEDGFATLRLPFPPCVEVLSVKYRDSANVEQTLANTSYIVKKPADVPAEIKFIDVDQLPDTYEHPRAVSVEFKAGYGQVGAPPVPRAMKRLVKLLAGHFFENPEATVNEPRIITMNRAIDLGADWLMKKLRIPHEYRDWQ